MSRAEHAAMSVSQCCRSTCFRLELPDLVPLLPFLLWRGRCRHCGVKIPLAIPAMEAGMIAVVIFTAMRLPGNNLESCRGLFVRLDFAAPDSR